MNDAATSDTPTTPATPATPNIDYDKPNVFSAVCEALKASGIEIDAKTSTNVTRLLGCYKSRHWVHHCPHGCITKNAVCNNEKHMHDQIEATRCRGFFHCETCLTSK